MPWSSPAVSEIRLAFVHQVRTLHIPVDQAATAFGISRKTAYKWLARFDRRNTPLVDRPRTPHSSPDRTAHDLEQRILELRDQFHWGAAKIQALLKQQHPRLPWPSVRTVHNILVRHQRVRATEVTPPQPQRFERSQPHQLWQCDFKGPVEVERRKIHPFTLLDDHSRYLLALQACTDLTMKSAFDILWNVMGDVGMPEAILADNSFGSLHQSPKTLSWFESCLVRLDIQPLHGRPYHPQTQGKVERLHGTLQQEVWPYVRRDRLDHFQHDIDHWRTDIYNTLRPHQALGFQTPLSRFRPSSRSRPAKLPEPQYEPHAVLRKVAKAGEISYRGFLILAGAGLVGQYVQIKDLDTEIEVFYCRKRIRSLVRTQLIQHKFN